MTNGKNAALLLCPLLLSGLPACSDMDRAIAGVSLDSPPKVEPAPDQEARFRDPVAASQLREKAWDMLSVMSRDTEAQVRANALEAMGKMPQRLEPLLVPALKDENAGVRSTAATMIGKLKLGQTAPAARPLLSDPSPFVRASAIFALAACGADVDQTPLASMLTGDSPARVKAHIVYILGELKQPGASGLVRESSRSITERTPVAEKRMFLVQVSEALVKLGDQSQLEPIRAALYPTRPEDLEITALAAQILGQLEDKGAMDELIYLTAYKDKQGHRMPAEIRLAAAGSLARLGLDKGTFVADEYAANENAAIRAQAAFVYGEIGLAKNLAKLNHMLSDPAGIVRVAAAGAVLKVRMPDGAQ